MSGETDGGRPPRARVVARGPDGELTLYPRVVLGADGLRSRVARALGATRRLPRLGKVSFTFHVRGRGPSPDVGRLRLDAPLITLGLAPLAPPDEQGRAIWNATLVATTASRRSRTPGRDEVERLLRDPAGALQDALGRVDLRWGEPPEIVGGPWASGPFDWPTDPAPAPGVLLLGDAAGYFDPLTGQGMYRALRSAELAATAAERILRGDGKGERRRYARALRSAFGPGRRVQRAVESVLARDRVRRPILRLLGRRPGALSHLIEVTGDARPARALMGAHFLGALLRTAAHEG